MFKSKLLGMLAITLVASSSVIAAEIPVRGSKPADMTADIKMSVSKGLDVSVPNEPKYIELIEQYDPNFFTVCMKKTHPESACQLLSPDVLQPCDYVEAKWNGIHALGFFDVLCHKKSGIAKLNGKVTFN